MEILNETWMQVDGYAKFYVSNFGRVKNIENNRMITLTNIKGYDVCRLSKTHRPYVHKLVASAFITNPHGLPVVDHIDGHPSNNHVNNLRWATIQNNNRNRTKHITTTYSKYKGVSWDKRRNDKKDKTKKWVVHLRYNGRLLYIGSFINEETAGRAYDDKAVELFGEFARLNFPEEWE